MPTYEYKCLSCGRIFEKFHGMSDTSPRPCPNCGGATEKLIGTGGGVIFKGSGFYSTDYKKGAGSAGVTRCGKDTPCCGRATPCDKPLCS